MQNPPGLSGEDFCKSPDGGSEYNSHIADFTTDFHKEYRDAIVDFLGKTKMDMLETDVSRHDTTDQRCTLPGVPVQQGRCGQGPYEGATCAPTNNSGFSHVNNSQVGAEPLTPPPHARTAAPVLAQVCRLWGQVGQWNATLQFYRTLKEKYNTYLTVPDPYWMSGGTNKEPMGYTDAWNHIPSDTNGTLEYLTMGRMYLCEPLCPLTPQSSLFFLTWAAWLLLCR